jgi:hypothetical protein
MRRLHPDPCDPVDVAESYDDSTRAPHDGRPWLYLCMIASADGATAVDGRSGTLGGPGDRAVFNARGYADLVLVGAGTVRRALRATQARRPPDRDRHARRRGLEVRPRAQRSSADRHDRARGDVPAGRCDPHRESTSTSPPLFACCEARGWGS